MNTIKRFIYRLNKEEKLTPSCPRCFKEISIPIFPFLTQEQMESWDGEYECHYCGQRIFIGNNG